MVKRVHAICRQFFMFFRKKIDAENLDFQHFPVITWIEMYFAYSFYHLLAISRMYIIGN